MGNYKLTINSCKVFWTYLQWAPENCEKEDDIKEILKCIDVVTKQIVLIVTY